MSFKNLKVDELRSIAEFFVVDVVTADEEKGASKRELVAALASGDEPVTWEQYKTIYLPAVKPEAVEPVVVKSAVEPEAPVDKSDWLIVKYGRQNPTFEILGVTFTKKHPFAQVPPTVAEYVIQNVEGFRLALPSEVADYYN